MVNLLYFINFTSTNHFSARRGIALRFWSHVGIVLQHWESMFGYEQGEKYNQNPNFSVMIKRKFCRNKQDDTYLCTVSLTILVQLLEMYQHQKQSLYHDICHDVFDWYRHGLSFWCRSRPNTASRILCSVYSWHMKHCSDPSRNSVFVMFLCGLKS